MAGRGEDRSRDPSLGKEHRLNLTLALPLRKQAQRLQAADVKYGYQSEAPPFHLGDR